ncbi:hypothetical protein O181_102445 [Austropuccinia psidii MF-1]|uniref:Uncharacterized protein n=1 Tax=Austropuccinia psidii MF-1 TaxID=1389203 RepID=A0A9Q3PIR9_9BASI|nr:hypothetical protein [Austropuccinia psidii MF-1]
MELETPSRRGHMNLRRSRSFSGLSGFYPRISELPSGILGESEDEEGDWSVEEKYSDGNEVASYLSDSTEVPVGPYLSLYNQIFFPKAKQNLIKIMEQMTQLIGNFT